MLTRSKPIDQVPYSPQYPDLQDWDDPPTCILWPEFRDTLSQIRSRGTLPESHQSHDHLNKQVEVDVDEGVLDEAKRGFERIEERQREEGFEVVWYIVDGFVLYYDPVSPSTPSPLSTPSLLINGLTPRKAGNVD